MPRDQSFLQATLPLGSHEGCIIWEESTGLVWLPRFRSWPGLILVSPIVKCDRKLECAVLMSRLSWPQMPVEAGLFN